MISMYFECYKHYSRSSNSRNCFYQKKERDRQTDRQIFQEDVESMEKEQTQISCHLPLVQLQRSGAGERISATARRTGCHRQLALLAAVATHPKVTPFAASQLPPRHDMTRPVQKLLFTGRHIIPAAVACCCCCHFC